MSLFYFEKINLNNKRPSFIDKLPFFTREDVRLNINRNWIIIGNLVFDLTDFLKLHPGGDEILLEFIGMDATSVFEDMHSNNIKASIVLLKYVIGRLKGKEENKEINIINSKMSKEMENEVIDYAILANIKYNNKHLEIAKYIEEEFNNKYGKYWCCIVGEGNFQTSCYYNSNNYICFNLNQLNIILFKTP
ncbi:Cytochrome b5 heme-binding domain-containing protein [Meloidogyne graminicola]|uniref:Cytochrome b5 heme-binding domain-containing protein n=1 Tax=Meloidogyne graminicola TaxID=189291 RepID=A0A8S9ZSL8_9BILA|nr:Cytochrome b5 heme-binding domain-containing protein [Meloidogyne graminicola]